MPRGPYLKAGQQHHQKLLSRCPLRPPQGGIEELGFVFLPSMGGMAGRWPPRASTGRVHGGKIWMEGIVFNILHTNSGLFCFVS